MKDSKDNVSRRGLIKLGALGVLATAAAPLTHLYKADAAEICNPEAPTTGSGALAALLAGNKRWATGTQIHPGEDMPTLNCLANNPQTPFASILACSDSRTSPDLFFDEGPGNMFVARTAGNTTLKHGAVVDSLLFGTKILGSPILMIVGHSACGAVIAAVGGCKGAKHVTACTPNTLLPFVDQIYPAVIKAKNIVKSQGGDPEDPNQVVPVATVQNVIIQAQLLKAFFLKSNPGLLVAGGVYDLGTRLVTQVF